ncbi:MAG: hypothetical protein Q4G71_02080 [Pseudomonadota bacterium]|nr:hypothetical protein [Pseudomonadota bacterium]
MATQLAEAARSARTAPNGQENKIHKKKELLAYVLIQIHMLLYMKMFYYIRKQLMFYFNFIVPGAQPWPPAQRLARFL